jgi:hypothetical protein
MAARSTMAGDLVATNVPTMMPGSCCASGPRTINFFAGEHGDGGQQQHRAERVDDRPVTALGAAGQIHPDQRGDGCGDAAETHPPLDAVGLGEAEILIEAMAQVVPVQQVGVGAHGMERLLHQIRDGRLARAGQSGCLGSQLS